MFMLLLFDVFVCGFVCFVLCLIDYAYVCVCCVYLYLCV